MNPVLTQQRCAVRECGAIIVVGEVGGRALALNPTWFDVAVPGADGQLVMTRGLQPHSATCVDVTARLGRHTAAARA